MNTFPNKAPLAATADPATSHAAGKELTATGRRDLQKHAVLHVLQDRLAVGFQPVTSAEIAAWYGFDRYMVARRLPDLERDGLIERTGFAMCTVSRRMATAWRAK